MVKTQRTGPTAARFVEETVALIAEKGGSRDVNLREVSRRVGCAHTNVYNYFASFDDLLWEAFRRVLRAYGDAMTRGLDESLTPIDYFRQLVTNLASFPQENPGLYRFIGSDPLDVEDIPGDILATVTHLKTWMLDTFKAVSEGRLSDEEAEEFCNITYAYVDGETFNLINGRVVPGEDIPSRIVENAVRLFRVLTHYDPARPERPMDYPQLERDGN